MKNGYRQTVVNGTLPADVAPALARLRADRAPLAARLDAIDLAIENLTRAYEPIAAKAAAPAAAVHRRRARRDMTSAAERRTTLLALIARAPRGLTAAELRLQTPEIDGKARSNALERLRREAQIVRDGRTWRAA